MNCAKVLHNRLGGYLHEAGDDLPFSVEGVLYCGRCHFVCDSSGRCSRSVVAQKRLDVLEELAENGRLVADGMRVYVKMPGGPRLTCYTLTEAADAEIERREKENDKA